MDPSLIPSWMEQCVWTEVPRWPRDMVSERSLMKKIGLDMSKYRWNLEAYSSMFSLEFTRDPNVYTDTGVFPTHGQAYSNNVTINRLINIHKYTTEVEIVEFDDETNRYDTERDYNTHLMAVAEAEEMIHQEENLRYHLERQDRQDDDGLYDIEMEMNVIIDEVD